MKSDIWLKEYNIESYIQDAELYFLSSENQKALVLRNLIIMKLKRNRIFLNRSSYDFEDVVQEILFDMWLKVNNYDKFLKTNCNFGQWMNMLFKQSRFAVNYRINNSKQNEYENSVLNTLNQEIEGVEKHNFYADGDNKIQSGENKWKKPQLKK